MSIAKDTSLRRQGLAWDAALWDERAWRMADMMFDMKWLPPGRGLWLNGTDYIYERGGRGSTTAAGATPAPPARWPNAGFIMAPSMRASGWASPRIMSCACPAAGGAPTSSIPRGG
jgi:hypothetical protein